MTDVLNPTQETATLRAAHLEQICAALVQLFNQQPLEAQPRYLLDTQCGDGSLLRALFEAVASSSARGRELGRLPLELVGVHAGDGAAAHLDGLPYRLLDGQFGTPQAMLDALAAQGISERENILPLLDGAACVPQLEQWRQLCGRHGIVLLHGQGGAERTLRAAGAAGLLPRAGSLLRLQPAGAGAAATLLHLEPRPVAIRAARPRDIEALLEIDQACWAEPMQTPREEVMRRIVQHPDDIFVLDQQGEAIGVLYTQPVGTVDQLYGLQWTDIGRGRVADGPVLEFISLNVLPGKRSSGLGDQLIDFALDYARCSDRIERVAAVSRCSAFGAQPPSMAQEAYLRLRKPGGQLVDPLLSFHESHGAEIVGLVPGFRPADSENHGCGVLVHYDLQARPAAFSAAPEAAVAADLPPPAGMPALIEALVGQAWGKPGASLPHERAFMDLGLESMQLLQLQSLLSERFQRRFDSTFLFRHNTIAAVAAALAAEPAPAPAAAAVPAPAPAAGQEGLPSLIEGLVRRAWGKPEASLPHQRPFIDIGLESMQLLQLQSLLSERFEQRFDSTFLSRHNTIDAVASALAGVPTREAPAASPVYDSSSQEIAIVGLACRLPGGGPEGFWQLLRDGKDGVRAVPENRWWWPEGDAASRHFEQAGYLDDIDCFDAGMFRIAPAEAERIDPQQRLLLELSWELLEDAGIDPAALRASATGVWIGACHFDYRDLAAQGEAVSAYTATGTYGSILPNRLSYFYDLKGPSMLIDTACSSSLVALHDAVQSLRRGECSMAIAGGVNLICTPNNTHAFARAGMLSPSGRCHTFDSAADGYIRGEGAALVLLKPLAQAVADGDRIHGVIAGSAVNHGGAANSLTAPSPQAQCDVITQAYRDAGLSPSDVSYVEAHGTGTRLGDPIELSALTQAVHGLLPDGAAGQWECAVGSVKTHIGHLEGAAGIAGLVKVLLALRHEWLPGNLHFNQLNPHIDLAGSPFRPLGQGRAWPRAKVPRCAGISSFGFGGVSAHMLVHEFIDVRQPVPPSAVQVIPLSAANVVQLRQVCADLLAFLSAPGTPSLEEVAWTLQTGRAALPARLAIVVESLADLCASLENYLSGADDERLFGSVVQVPAPPRTCPASLAKRWASGVMVDWTVLHGAVLPRRVSLPSYPFARERYWMPVAPASAAAQGQAVLHPLLHRNSSDFSGQRFSTTLTGKEFVLSDHVLQGKRVLPGVAYLEMARAAVAASTGLEEGQGVRLEDTVWLRPVVAGAQAVEVHTALSVRADGAIDFQMAGGDDGDGPLFCQGRATLLADAEAPAQADIGALRQRCAANHLEQAEFYRRFSDAGFAYGPAFQGVAEVWWGEAEALARLRMPEQVEAQAGQYLLHPSMLDAAVQGATAALGLLANGHSFAMPYAVEGLDILGPCSAAMWALCRRSAPGKLDIELCDDTGKLCVRMTGLSVRQTELATHSGAATLLWQRGWRVVEAMSPTQAPAYGRHRVLLAGPVGAAVAAIEERLGAQCLLADAVGSLVQRFTAVAEQLWAELHGLLLTRPAAPVLVQLVVAGGGEEGVLAGLSGMLKTARIEYSQLVAQVVEVDSAIGSEALADVLRQAACSPQATVLRYADGQLSEEYWLEQQPAPAVAPWRERGVYLLTGGAGGLGLIFAREIAAKAPGSTLVLSARGAMDAERRALLAQISALGVRAEYCQADVADAAQVAQLFAHIRQHFGALHGILHGAGVVRDGLMARKAAPELETVFGPKVAGLVNLEQASREFDLDWLVCLASTSGALGNAGQADYGAANAFMDRYAESRNAPSASARILAIDWPLWEQGGMRVDDAVLRRMAANGVQPLPTAEGLAAFYQALSGQAAQVMVLHGAPARLRAWLEAGAGTVTQLATVDSAAPAAAVDQQSLRDGVRRVLRGMVSRLLKTASGDLDDDVELNQYGLDSISLTELTGRVNDRFGIRLTPTFFFEFGTLRAVLEQLLADHAPALAVAMKIEHAAPPVEEAEAATVRPKMQNRLARMLPAPAGAKQGPSVSQLNAEPIAIIGMSGRYPQARDLDAFWQNLREGRDSVTEVPAERWDWREYYSTDRAQEGRHYSKWGGFIEGVDLFDPLFFNISPREARNIDPQERLFLQQTWMAIEDAGYTRAALQGKNGGQVGVYAGVMYSEYQLFGAQAAVHGDGIPIFGSLASIANRVSYALNLHGPSMTLDTMCSSSLTAIHIACQDLKLGRTDMALAGGVNVTVHPHKYHMLSAGQFISSDGHCQSFGEGGDGYIPGEGVGVVVLKRLSDAQRDGDRICGVILGSALNHGGRTNGYTVPNPQAQSSAIGLALAEAKVDARHISYVEAHGTGTKLGDPIEIAALGKAFGQYTQERGFCRIGSAKSNIGHCESAAGIAGLMKVLLQMRHGEIVPSLHSAKLNPHIDFEQTPFVVNQTLTEWERPVIDGREVGRTAGLSSFGAGGSNAHMIVQEYRQEQPTATASGPAAIVLSARTAQQLHQKAIDLLAYLEREECADLQSIAYTLQTGREPMEERLGIVAADIGQLAERLRGFIAGDQAEEELYRGQAKRSQDGMSLISQDEDMKEAVGKWIARRKYGKLLDLWSKGLDIDWQRLHGDVKPQRVSLPVYPFAEERYWVAMPAALERGGQAAQLHPLLHANTSDLSEQSYCSWFDGSEFFLADHQVKLGDTRHKMLPAVAYLEMARAAIELALPAQGRIIELRQTVWSQPVIVDQKRQVSIALHSADDGVVEFEIYSAGLDGEETVHCEGAAAYLADVKPQQIELAALEAQMTAGALDAESLYIRLRSLGLEYGTAHRPIASVAHGEAQALVRMRLPDEVRNDSQAYVLHPSLMDGALQACASLLAADESVGTVLPYAMESVRVFGPCQQNMLAWVREADGSSAALRKLDIDLCDDGGAVRVQMRGFTLRAMDGAALAPAQDLLVAVPQWQERPAPAQAAFNGKRHIWLCGLEQVSPDALSELMAGARCTRLDGDGTLVQRYNSQAVALFEQVQTMLRRGLQGQEQLQLVVADNGEQNLWAGLAGLLRTASLENPQLRAQVVLVDAAMAAPELAALLQSEPGSPSMVRYRDGRRSVQAWEQQRWQGAEWPVAFRDDGIYLITGGLGGLGQIFVQEILRQTSTARIVLTGRSASDKALPERTIYRQVDLEDAAAVQALIDDVTATFGRLDGILHSAGQVADEFILNKTSATFAQVLGPKVAGTANLDLATRGIALDFMVLFSSIASAMGNVGQADYASGNGFMDQFAAYRNGLAAKGERLGRTVAVNWPLWQEGGMKMEADSQAWMMRSFGLAPLHSAAGLQALYGALALEATQALVLQGDRKRMLKLLESTSAVEAAAAPHDTIESGVAGMLEERLHEHLRRQLAAVLQMPASRIEVQAPLETYGIDSVLALNITRELERTFGPLSKTLMFEYQTVEALSRYFLRQHAGKVNALFAQGVAVEVAPAVTAARPIAAAAKPGRKRAGRQRAQGGASSRLDEPIAIIGMSGRYPQARDLDAFWQNLREGRDCVTEVPAERWDWREYYSADRTQEGRHYSKWGGFIEGVDQFDPLFFNISPREARNIDPQERLFLQQTWMAIEDAGYTRAGLQGGPEGNGKVGVYAGVMYSEYQLYGAQAAVNGQSLPLIGSLASIANRVSYALNLHGPSMTLDTMCSSSLTAIHIACQDLKLGRTDMALAGGVNVTVHPQKYHVLSAGQFISSDGHCQSFGEGGDGYIPGEGVGVVVLKRLSDALRDGDRICGVILGSALNHGGKTNGYTVPNPHAQSSAIGQALAEAKIDARHVSYVEAHGTGTKLGDPIEIAALGKAFGETTQEKGFCRIGSAKSNIGHCESAAGIAGLMKVLLQMRHGEIVPSLHSSRLNPHIDFEQTPFVVNQTLTAWERPVIDGREVERTAGLSSFGAGGSNAHLIIQEYREHRQPYAAAGPAALVLSARTAQQLRQKAIDLLAYLQRGDCADLHAIAYTLQTGREAMEERLGILAADVGQLAARLQAFVGGDEEGEDLYRGQAKRSQDGMNLINQDEDMKEAVGKWIARRKYGKLLELWAKGLDVDWLQLYGQQKPSRASLPAYPFSQERYWIELAPSARSLKARMLHPLVHENTSQFGQQSYSSLFEGREQFLVADLLPAAAYLEMARAAIALALPAEGRLLELQEVEWVGPAAVDGKRKLHIALQEYEDDSVEFEIYSTGEAGDEVVLCQGGAVYGAADCAPPVDLSALDALVPLALPPGAQEAAQELMLHPLLADGALRACSSWLERQDPSQTSQACGVESVRITRPCPAGALAWVRASESAVPGALDVDLYDSSGNVCVQLLGVQMRKVRIAKAAAVRQATEPATAVMPAMPARLPAASGKPQQVALAAPAPMVPTGSARSLQPFVQLSVLGAADAVAALGNGVFEIALARDSGLVPRQLLDALQRVRSMPDAKVVVLRSAGREFLRAGAKLLDDAIAIGLLEDIRSFPLPLVAVMKGDATGLGFLIGALCDFMVCTVEASYGFDTGHVATSSQFSLLAKRFGDLRAFGLLHGHAAVSGQQLLERGFTMPVLADHLVEQFTDDLVQRLAEKPQHALRMLKGHLARNLPSVTAGVSSVALPSQEAGFEYPCMHLQLDDSLMPGGQGRILTATLAGEVNAAGDMLQELCGLIERASADRSHAALILASRCDGFLPLGEAEIPLFLRLRELVLAAPMPVIAVLDRSTRGLAWLIALHCDSCVFNADAVFAADMAHLASRQSEVAAIAVATLEHRLGRPLVDSMLFEAREFTGAELQQRQTALAVVPAGAEQGAALELAATWAGVPGETLQQWRAALHVELSVAGSSAASAPAVQEGAVALKSTVVSVVAHADGVLLVRMQDREARNMFSPALVAGMEEVFAHIAANPAYKAVVLTGYDSYFASGGTKENLLAIQAGTVKFTDHTVFDLALRCDIPVIAAMQGHGIGAGWALGMFADFSLFCERSEYVSPYMNYGFTPGAGATLVFPAKIGYDLARETMLTGQQFSGRMLRERGMTPAVLQQDQVIPAALAMAHHIARLPRELLVAMKGQLAGGLRSRLEDTYQRELEMHERTFVGRNETLQRIEQRFAGSPIVAAVPASRATVGEAESADVQADLQLLLAHELQVPAEEIGEDMQFVDLGLDSVSGVTWMRKINEKFGTSIDATRIYSHPTLKQLAAHVRQQMRPGADEQAGGNAALAPAAVPIAPLAAVPSGAGAVLQGLKELLSQELQLAEDEMGDDTQFIDLGMDSVSGVTWMRKVNERFGTAFDATIIYSHPSLSRLAARLEQETGTVAPVREKPAVPMPAVAAMPIAAPAQVPSRPVISLPASDSDASRMLVSRRSRQASRKASAPRREAIAVVGMAGQFPQARDVDAFWRNIAEGRDCISEVPASRWNIDAYYQPGDPAPGKTNSRWMGALEHYDGFDPLFFNISPVEAESMDPQQRLFLQACWNAIEHAGYNASAFSGSKFGVFVGCGEGDYLQNAQRLSAQGFTGSASSILAARISYFLNLQGPCLAIDTACSSSLVAIAHACDSLVNGNSDVALAGGVYVMSGPEMLIKTAQAGMLSADGRCFTFDQRANGFVPGEAVGTLLLKRLSDAQRDGDTIYSVIRGWGVNQDGKTNGITAPNPEAQARLQREVYQRFGIDPAAIGLIEAHGTGTKLGDPIEVQALRESFGASGGRTALGSVKSNIGHCLTAAGVTGVIKLVQALRHRQLPPTLHFRQLNEHIRLEGSPFYINDRLGDWEQGAAPRMAAISSFGFSGTNAHIVLEEYASMPSLMAQRPSAPADKLLVPLSAKTAEQLQRRAADLLAVLERSAPDLADIAYTLQVGRMAMEERVCFMVTSTGELADKLRGFLSGQRDVAGSFSGQARAGRGQADLISQDADVRESVVATLLAKHQYAKLAQLWCKGVDWDWSRLHGTRKAKRIALPTYPFATTRYWLGPQAAAPQAAAATGAFLHPLVQVNVSNLSGQRYRTDLDGTEAFLSDHKIRLSDGAVHKVLPGVAYLEMARAAIEDAVGGDFGTPELRDIVWLRPLAVASATRIYITVAPESDNEVGFQICSRQDGEEIVHCEGRGVFATRRAPAPVDLRALQARPGTSKREPGEVYAAFERMGLYYGPTHRCIQSLIGEQKELLAHLLLPTVSGVPRHFYTLHPSMMDCALQALIGLTAPGHRLPEAPLVPFALASLQVYGACGDEMYAWVRRAQGCDEDGMAAQVDIDLCDSAGNVCVQMRGFTCRTVSEDVKALPPADDVAFDDKFYESLLERIANKELTIEAAMKLR